MIQASAVEPGFNAIVAECPYANLRAVAEYRLRAMLPLPAILANPAAAAVVEAGMLYARAADGLDFGQVSPLDSMKISSAPVLLIHGLDDRRTPPDQSRQLAAVRPSKDCLWLVPNAGHANASAVAPDEFRRRLLNWFAAR
ncbi:MAG: prolyl oligopeptidase family serine peptidase [Bryobacteraceae bacterium]